MTEPLKQGSPSDSYPENRQDAEEFQVGGVERTLPDELQLEQLVSYLEATYDASAEQFLALLPDRITHAAMLMLGSAVDHTMPGVAFPGAVRAAAHELGTVFTPSAPSGAWGISLFDGPPSAREHSWRPEVAGAAELSGATILDLDAPAALPAALAFARAQGAEAVAVWAFGAAAEALAGLTGPQDAQVDAVVLTFPTALPELDGVPALVQVATRDEEAPTSWQLPGSARLARYHSTHRIATPAESRRRVRDVAEFLEQALAR
ncbi:hypothetical protein [Corynebacterium bouchesdurhonense]|uniref:hypothetical protein n=1 Tax=Corynebacterium bouchesdurhonense TaxID=1720192 RepID=UPI00082CFEFB|nr:hypothetical protein [Corynebacterium bouchesdurhonense]